MAQESLRQQQEQQQAMIQNNPMHGQWTQMQLLQQQQQQYDSNQAAAQLVGRQGAIKDVRSIIEDYRQRHPESVPRRGRRMKTVPTTNASLTMNSSGGGGVGGSSSCSLLMLMAANPNQNNNSNSISFNTAEEDEETGGGGGVVLEEEAVVVDDGTNGDTVVSSEVGGDINVSGMAKNSSAKKATGGRGLLINVNSGGGDNKQKHKSKVVNEKGMAKDRLQRMKAIVSVESNRRGREWQTMLSSLSESGTPATASPSSSVLSSVRPSSAESTSSSSASAINSILTQHGLLSAISVTSLGAGGGGSTNSGAETSSGRGSVTGNSHSLSLSLSNSWGHLFCVTLNGLGYLMLSSYNNTTTGKL